MSLDLYSKEIEEFYADVPTAKYPDAPFLSGTGMFAMQNLAKAARAGTMALGGAARLLEMVGEESSLGKPDTTISDSIFRFHDEVMQPAVDYWTPKPWEASESGKIVGQLLSTIPLVVASPMATVAATQLTMAEDLAQAGVDPTTANKVGAVYGAGLGVGIYVPILGRTLMQRVMLGGLGFNVGQGMAMRGAAQSLLEGTPAEGQFDIVNATDLTLDALLGLAFGGLAHVSPAMRKQGDEFWNRIQTWKDKLSLSDTDAMMAQRQSQHLVIDSLPGKPVSDDDVTANAVRTRNAITKLARDEPVDVTGDPKPRLMPDMERLAQAEEQVRHMEKVADTLRQEEGLPNPDVVLSAKVAEELEQVTEPIRLAPGGVTEDAMMSAARNAVDSGLIPDDISIQVGTRADGEPVKMTAKQYLDAIDEAEARLQDDVRLIEIAAECVLVGGAA